MNLFGALVAFLAALFKQHFKRDQKQQGAPGNPEGRHVNAKYAQQSLADQGKGRKNEEAGQTGTDRHAPTVRSTGALRQDDEDRHQTQRVNDHKQRDKDRDQFVHHFKAWHRLFLLSAIARWMRILRPSSQVNG